MALLHMPRLATAAGTLLVAVGVYLLFWALAKRTLLRLAGRSAHSSRDVSASIAHLSLRWNGLRPDSLALVSLVVSDPHLSFVTLPANARPSRSAFRSPSIVRRVAAFHVRSLAAFGHAAGSWGMAHFFVAAISFVRFVTAVLVQTLVLPLLAALIDLEISRLSISWTPSHDADTPDTDPAPAIVHLRVRYIHLGWAARSGSVPGPEGAPPPRRASLGDESDAPLPPELEQSLQNATSVALRMKLAARITWADVLVYALPSAVSYPRQAFPTSQSDALWSCSSQTKATWGDTCSSWGTEEERTARPDSPDARAVLHCPGRGQLCLKTGIYTTIRFASVQDNPEQPGEPLMSFEFDALGPEDAAGQESGGWRDRFSFSLGPLEASLHTCGVDMALPPLVADANALLSLLDHAKRSAERRRRRSSAGVSAPAPEPGPGPGPGTSTQDTSPPPACGTERAPAWLHLVHQSCIQAGGVRLLYTAASPNPDNATGEQEGALVALDVGPINAQVDPAALLEQKQGLLQWAWKLNRSILKRKRHPPIIDLIGTWSIERISARLLPAFLPSQKDRVPEPSPIASFHTLKGRCQVCVPIDTTPPLLHLEVGIAKILGFWELPSGKQGERHTSLLTALVRGQRQRPPRPAVQASPKPRLDQLLDRSLARILARMQFMFQVELVVREVQGTLTCGDAHLLVQAESLHGGILHLPPREDCPASRATSHAGIAHAAIHLRHPHTQEIMLDVRESSGEASLSFCPHERTPDLHIQGNVTGTTRAVRLRLDTPTSWSVLERVAAGLGRVGEQVRRARASVPRTPSFAPSDQVTPPAPSDGSNEKRNHTYRFYVNLGLLDFDGRCAALDPKRRPHPHPHPQSHPDPHLDDSPHHPHPHGPPTARAASETEYNRAKPSARDGVYVGPTAAYQLPPLCPPLSPTKGPVTGFRATFPRWRVELAAVRTSAEEGTTWATSQSSRAQLHLEPDALDEASARARTDGGTVLLRSTLHGLHVFAVDPSPAGGEATRHPVPALESEHHRHLLLRVPLSIFELGRSLGTQDGPTEIALSLRFPGCNILPVELANTYVMFMAIAAFRRVWVAAKAEMKPSTPSQSVPPHPVQPELQPEPQPEPRPRPLISLEISFGKLDVPIRLPNGLRLFFGLADFSARQSLSLPIPRQQNGMLQLPKFLFRFRHLVGAVYQKKGGLWKPLDEFEWVELVGWDQGAIEVDWSTMLPGGDKGPASSPPVEGAEDQRVEPVKHWPSLLVAGKHARLCIPFQFVFHEVVVGTSVGVKATKQLVHEALMGQLDYAVAPSEMKPVPLPPIRLRLRTLVVEMEDSMIDSHLRVKHRIGLPEAQRRAEREAAFQREMQTLLSAQGREPSSERPKKEKPPLHHVQTLSSLRRAGSSAVAQRHISPFKRSKDSSCYSSRSTSFSERGDDSEEGDLPASMDMVTATIEAARRALNEHDSQQWIALARSALDNIRQSEDQVRAKLRGIHPIAQPDILGDSPARYMGSADSERPWTHLRDLHRWAPLFRSTMTHVDLRLSQPHTYAASEPSARKYIDSFGDPIPEGLTFSVFVPMHLEWEMDEWMCNLRDYPLPLVHVLPDSVQSFDPLHPAVEPTTSPPAFRLATDLCIAEQMGDERSTCHLQACLVHEDCVGACGSDYVLQIPKVTMPTKMFGHPIIQIHSTLPFQLAWGQSMAPAIAEVTKAFDGFSSPALDPSPKIGFWDKIPLILHGSFELLVAKPSAVQLFLKGSRDPYNLRGHGAGWVQVWSEGVRAVVAPPHNKEREVIQIFSGSYELAIPDLNVFTGPAACSLVSLAALPALRPGSSNLNDKPPTDAVRNVNLPPLPLQKIVWSLKGNVVWGCGFVLEQTCNGPNCVSTPKCTSPIPFYRHCRFFDSISHWRVLPRTPEYLDKFPREEWGDTYTGWRHHHVHLSLAVRSRAGPSEKEAAANSLHVTPLVSSHFWAWIGLFSSALSLPIRAGALFPSLPSPSPKFGQHCATIKYRIDLAPMSLAHIYLQHDAARHKRGANLFLGLKARIGSFNVDLHQRQQEVISTNKATGKTQTVLHKPISAAEVDFRDGEMRVCVAKILDLGRAAHWVAMTGGSADDADESAAEIFLQDGPDESIGDVNGWWDFRDYVELGSRIGREPELRSTRARSEKVLEWPAFNYFRRNPTRKEVELQDKAYREQAIKEGDMVALEQVARHAHHLGTYGESKFGHEGTHSCLMGQDQTPDEIQDKLLHNRIGELRAGPKTAHAKRSIHIIRDFAEIVPYGMESFGLTTHKRKQALTSRREGPVSLARAQSKVHADGVWSVPTYVPDETLANRRELSEIHGHWNNFGNRYVVHNPVLHIQEGTRNILLRYYISTRLRRGQAHFLRYAALKSIQDLRMGQKTDNNPSSGGDVEVLRALLDDTIGLFDTTHAATAMKNKPHEPSSLVDPYRGIRPDLEVRNSTVCAILRPQIVLHSEVDVASSVVLTATRLRLEVFGVYDPTVLDHELNSHVLNRSWFFSDQVKVWAAKIAAHRVLPIEAILDPFDQEGQQTVWEGFHQLTSQLDLQVQFDHFNPLRIANEDEPAPDCTPFQVPKDQEHLLHRTDLVRVTAPPLKVVADAEQFEAIYNATNLLLYSDPTYKQLQERLKTLLLAFDFTDSRNLTRVISSLQEKIRDTMCLHEEYEASYPFLSQQGRYDAGECTAHLRDLIEEMNLFMGAIKTAQDQQSGDKDKKSGLRLEANAEQIVWTMLRSRSKSRVAFRRTEQETERMAELHVQRTSFIWLSKADSSIANALSIQDVEARDVRPDAIFPVILSKYKDSNGSIPKNKRFIEAVWQVLAPVAGISIVDRFEVDVHPLNIQLEKAVGSEIAEYAFASRHKKPRPLEDKHSEKGQGLYISTSSTSHPSGLTSDSTMSPDRPSPTRHSGILKFRSPRASDHSARRSGPGASEQDPLAVHLRSSIDHDVSSVSLGLERARGPTKNHKPNQESNLATFNRMDDVDENTMRIASEMRERAAHNRTFVYVRIPKTVVCLSYRGDNKVMNLYDSVVQTPPLELCQTTGTLENVMDEFKKAVVRAAWSQKTTILRGFLRHRPRRITKRLALRDRLRKQAASASAKAQRRRSVESQPDKMERTGYISASSSDLESEEEQASQVYSTSTGTSLSRVISADVDRVQSVLSRLQPSPDSSISNPSASVSGSDAT